MKKTFLKCLALIACLFVTTAFAADKPGYKTVLQPIPEGLKIHRTVKGTGPSTDILVINYTDTSIILSSPTYNPITTKTSARITCDACTGPTEIRLGNASGTVFFDTNVANFATVSVYLTNNQYNVIVS